MYFIVPSATKQTFLMFNFFLHQGSPRGWG